MAINIEKHIEMINNLNVSFYFKDIFESEGSYHEFILNNMVCRMIRNSVGCWCGYVGLNSRHVDYENFEAEYIVHGGITWCDFLIVENSEYNSLFWLGFDCAHYGDFSPSYSYEDGKMSNYRNFDYVKNELDKLSKQIYEKSFKHKVEKVLKKL